MDPNSVSVEDILRQKQKDRVAKAVVLAVVVGGGLYLRKKYNLKIDTKVAAKVSELQKTELASDLPQIQAWLKATPGMAYIAHGGKWAHLLAKNDTVLTIFGNFDKMSDAEAMRYVEGVVLR